MGLIRFVTQQGAQRIRLTASTATLAYDATYPAEYVAYPLDLGGDHTATVTCADGPVTLTFDDTMGDSWQVTVHTNPGRTILLDPVAIEATTSGLSATYAPKLSFYAKDYGYVADALQTSATANTTAIQNAINAAHTAGGGYVVLPLGTGYINSTLTLWHYVWLRGQGIFATALRLADASNCDMVINHVSTGVGDSNAPYVGVFDLTLDGNVANQTTGGKGISFTTNPLTTAQTGTTDEQFDMHHLIERVRVRKTYSDGITLAGRSEIHLNDVHVEFCNGYGFDLTFDTHAVGCTAAQNGKAGFHLNKSSSNLTGCKSYLNGQVDTVGAGFEFGSGCYATAVTGCSAQNNKGQGFYLNGCTAIVVQGEADSNSYDAVGYAGVEMNNAVSCLVTVACQQGKQGGVQVGNQSYAVRYTGTCTNNVVNLTHAATNSATIGTAVHPSSVSPTGMLTVNAQTISGAANGILGDGSDGVVTLDGIVTVGWASLAGSTYTMSRPAFTSGLTVNSGVTLVTNGFYVYCTGTVTNNGTISADGANATGTTATVSQGNSGFGGAGQVGAGSAGGAGGPSGGTAGAGGAGGTGAAGAAGTRPTSNLWPVRQPYGVLAGTVVIFGTAYTTLGSPGGGGGGGDGANKGGAGGAGASPLVILARVVTIGATGVLSAKGGNGFTPVAGNAGGGGGGGGGLILIYSTNAWTNGGTTVVTGGTQGSGVGTGAAGTAGGAGQVANIILA